MNLQDLEIDKGTANLHYETDNIEFILNFDWSFYAVCPHTYDYKIDVYCTDAEQWINGVRHSFFPSVDEMKAIKLAIEDVIAESPIDWGIEEQIESDKDYYEELKNDN